MEHKNETPLGSPESIQKRHMIHHIIAATLFTFPEALGGLGASDEWDRLFDLDTDKLKIAFNSAEQVLNGIDDSQRLALLNRAITFGQ